MALGTEVKLAEDTPSEMVRLSRLELNKLLDAVDALVDATQLADFAAMKAAAAAIDMSTMRKVVASIERPAAHTTTSP